MYDTRVPFVDRKVELGVLEDEYSRGGFSLVVVYGRRRVGKTRMIREFLRDKRAVYYVAAELSYPQICGEFSRLVAAELGFVPGSNDVVGILEETAATGERLVVVLDEFQYIVEADPTLPSRLQRSIDGVLGDTRLMLVLSGSAVSFFENRLLGYRAPLHGRRTASIRLRPMRFIEARGFMEELSISDSVRAYSVLGGTPAYLSAAYGRRSLEEILRAALSPGSPLLDEAESLLRQELREPRSYISLLRAVAEGRSNPYEAASAAGIDPRAVHRYLAVLEGLDIVRLEKPLGYRRGARVFFVDEYFRFWSRYIVSLRSMLELGEVDEAVEAVMRSIDTHASQAFEKIVGEMLPELRSAGIVVTRPREAGRWWHRGMEIDLVVREPGISTTFIEAKWSDLSLAEARRVLGQLEEKAAASGLQSPANHYVVIARSVEGIGGPVARLDEHRVIVDFERAYPRLASRNPLL